MAGGLAAVWRRRAAAEADGGASGTPGGGERRDRASGAGDGAGVADARRPVGEPAIGRAGARGAGHDRVAHPAAARAESSRARLAAVEYQAAAVTGVVTERVRR